MRLVVRLRDSANTELLDESVPKIRRRDHEQQFSLLSESVFTPLGLPLSFEIDIGPKGQGLKVRSVDTVLLWVFGFNVYWLVQLRLPTDEVADITLHDK